VKKKYTYIAALAGLALAAGSANAALTSQLGILDLTANGGINPATGFAWEAGDTYRFIFATSTGTSCNIHRYCYIQHLRFRMLRMPVGWELVE